MLTSSFALLPTFRAQSATYHRLFWLAAGVARQDNRILPESYRYATSACERELVAGVEQFDLNPSSPFFSAFFLLLPSSSICLRRPPPPPGWGSPRTERGLWSAQWLACASATKLTLAPRVSLSAAAQVYYRTGQIEVAGKSQDYGSAVRRRKGSAGWLARWSPAPKAVRFFSLLPAEAAQPVRLAPLRLCAAHPPRRPADRANPAAP